MAPKNYDAAAVPFFARYLEGQVTQELTAEDLDKISGGNDKDPIKTQRNQQ